MRSVMDVNFWGTIYGCRSVYPVMRKQGFGHFINTASLAGLIPGGLTSIYSTSKHAVVGFSLTLRAEARQYGIKVSTLCPGYMRTNVQKTIENVSSDHQNDEEAGGFALRNRRETIGGYRAGKAPVSRRLLMNSLDVISPAARFANGLRERIESVEVL